VAVAAASQLAASALIMNFILRLYKTLPFQAGFLYLIVCPVPKQVDTKTVYCGETCLAFCCPTAQKNPGYQ